MKNILVIEDSKTINNIINKELSKLQFNVSQAFTLHDARQFLKEKQFELIILDLHLPDGEGSELIAHIQSLTKTKVVVLTSSQDDELREELFQYGILDYIIKDTNLIYSISEIVKIIHTISSDMQGKILLIDDSKFICKQIKTILEPRNYVLHYALTAVQGLEKLQYTDFDLIILDMELPDIHGLKVLELIRKQNRFIGVPIVVLSGTSTPEIIRNVLKNGANDFLKKPFVYEEFILKVDLWIDYFKKEKILEEKTSQLEYLNKNLQQMVTTEVEKNRKKDKMMFQQSRQAQMGEMIAMIAHQWRQPLNAISAATNVLTLKAKRETLDTQTTLDIVAKIQEYLQYLSTTIDDFRDFFKPDKDMVLSDFETIISKALILIENSIHNKNININKVILKKEQFLTYENELVQVILNILKNAEDILQERAVKDPQITLTIDGTKLTIADNAGGIPEEFLEKIFDPYFSTKTQKNGTGLGLYMSKIIIQEHCNGTLDVFNTKEGANFVINLKGINE